MTIAVTRVCFQLQVDPLKIDEYRRRHGAVWPEMLVALHGTSWHNYSLFLRDYGSLIGYFETPDLQKALDGMAATEVNARWQAELSEFFLDLEGAHDPGFLRLPEVFNLADQLGSADRSTERP